MNIELRPEWVDWIETLPERKHGPRVFTSEEQELIRLALPRTSLEAIASRLRCSTKTLRAYLAALATDLHSSPVSSFSSSSPLPELPSEPELDFTPGDEFVRIRF